jgi:hypothetical protein
LYKPDFETGWMEYWAGFTGDFFPGFSKTKPGLPLGLENIHPPIRAFQEPAYAGEALHPSNP